MIEANEPLVFGQVVLFLVKNRLQPILSDTMLLHGLVLETARRLAEGDMQAVNRRFELTVAGVLNPSGHDIVPGFLLPESEKRERKRELVDLSVGSKLNLKLNPTARYSP